MVSIPLQRSGIEGWMLRPNADRALALEKLKIYTRDPRNANALYTEEVRIYYPEQG